jgi:hypothetical protein
MISRCGSKVRLKGFCISQDFLSAGAFQRRPFQSPEIFAVHEFYSQANAVIFHGTLPSDARLGSFPGVGSDNLNRFTRFSGMPAAYRCAAPAKKDGPGIFFPCATKAV